jgi:hypothetical protein
VLKTDFEKMPNPGRRASHPLAQLGSGFVPCVTPQNFEFWNVTKIHYILNLFLNRLKIFLLDYSREFILLGKRLFSKLLN